MKMDVERFRSVAAVPATRSCRRSRRSFHFPSVLAVAPPLRSVVRPSIHVCHCALYPRRMPPTEGEVSSIHTSFCSLISAHHVRDRMTDMPGLPSLRPNSKAADLASHMPHVAIFHRPRSPSHMLWFQAKSDN